MGKTSKIGKVIGGTYRLTDVIGSGGMGVVYSALDVTTGEIVAVKLLRSEYADSPKIVKRFYREAKLADALRHPNICRVIDYGYTDNGEPYLVMPLLKGCAFSALLKDVTSLPLARAVDVITQTLKALQTAHEKVVHRDLKPDNIFITVAEDGSDFIKLLDFGISKMIEQTSPTTLTATGSVLGTVYYLAPEQAVGGKNIDHRADIYAMGVILYEALVGRRPFEGETYLEVISKIGSKAYIRPREAKPSIPKSLERIIAKAMAFEPDHRYSSAADMHDDLKRTMMTLAEEGEEITRHGAVPYLRRHQWRSAGVVAGIVLVGATGIALWTAHSHQDKTTIAGDLNIVSDGDQRSLPLGPPLTVREPMIVADTETSVSSDTDSQAPDDAAQHKNNGVAAEKGDTDGNIRRKPKRPDSGNNANPDGESSDGLKKEPDTERGGKSPDSPSIDAVRDYAITSTGLVVRKKTLIRNSTKLKGASSTGEVVPPSGNASQHLLPDPTVNSEDTSSR